MSQIAHVAKNLIEWFPLTIVDGGPEIPGFPLYRAWDGSAARPLRIQKSGGGVVRLRMDQGVSGWVVSFFALSRGHNLLGGTLQVDSSTNGTAWTARYGSGTITSDGNLAGILSTPSDDRYWRYTLTPPATASYAEVTELWLGVSYTWDRQAPRPDVSDAEYVATVEETNSGYLRTLVRGLPRQTRLYQNVRCGSGQRSYLRALADDHWQGGRNFWLRDHFGDWLFGQLRAGLGMREVAGAQFEYDFDFVEVHG